MRGEIYFVELINQYSGSVERGRRPVVVVSSEIGCRSASVVMVAPLTTKRKNLSCNVNTNWTCGWKPSQVLCNQLTTIPKAQLVDCVGKLTTEEIDAVDDAILISLGLIKKYRKEVQE